MKWLLLTIILLNCQLNAAADISAAADFEGVAELSVQFGNNTETLYKAISKPNDEIADPLLCRRAELALKHFKKVQREIEFLLQKIDANPALASKANLDEIDALELKKQASLNFLAAPAPALIVEWTLSNLADEDIQRLKTEAVSSQLMSFATYWFNPNGLFLTDKVDLIFNRYQKKLSLLIHSQLGTFCLTDRHIQLRISDPED